MKTKASNPHSDEKIAEMNPAVNLAQLKLSRRFLQQLQAQGYRSGTTYNIEPALGGVVPSSLRSSTKKKKTE